MDICDISNTDTILLSTVLIYDIVCSPNIVDNSTPGIYCRLGLGVLNGFLKFQKRFSLRFLAYQSAAFHYFYTT